MIKENLNEVKKNIETSSHRRPSAEKNTKVTLVAVTKNHGVEAMREAIDEGVTSVGENRMQEAAEKFAVLDRTVMRHLIGHLQTNKVKQAVQLFDLIHSVDSVHLAEELDKAAGKAGKIQDILLQVNLAKEESKFGLNQEDLAAVYAQADNWNNLRLRGLMCIAPNYQDIEMTRPLFRDMYQLYREMKMIEFKTARIDCLSMGMSHDYTIAVEEGANIVRVGTAIFGQRQY